MAGVSGKSFDTPDETRTPDKTKMDVLRLSGATVARITFQPGWKWSECIKPVTGTDSCQARHVGTIVAGRLHVVHRDTTRGLSAMTRWSRSSSKAPKPSLAASADLNGSRGSGAQDVARRRRRVRRCAARVAQTVPARGVTKKCAD
jgi:hypothetical protein